MYWWSIRQRDQSDVATRAKKNQWNLCEKWGCEEGLAGASEDARARAQVANEWNGKDEPGWYSESRSKSVHKSEVFMQINRFITHER